MVTHVCPLQDFYKHGAREWMESSALFEGCGWNLLIWMDFHMNEAREWMEFSMLFEVC
jgi:hypothetical protein